MKEESLYLARSRGSAGGVMPGDACIFSRTTRAKEKNVFMHRLPHDRLAAMDKSTRPSRQGNQGS